MVLLFWARFYFFLVKPTIGSIFQVKFKSGVFMVVHHYHHIWGSVSIKEWSQVELAFWGWLGVVGGVVHHIICILCTKKSQSFSKNHRWLGCIGLQMANGVLCWVRVCLLVLEWIESRRHISSLLSLLATLGLSHRLVPVSWDSSRGGRPDRGGRVEMASCFPWTVRYVHSGWCEAACSDWTSSRTGSTE